MPTVPHSTRPTWLPERKKGGWSKSDNARFYNSKTWRNAATVHKMQNPVCKLCEEKGITTPAEITDHITPISKGGSKMDFDNLQSLCRACHLAKTNKERNELKNV
ncbi:MAG: HNH endonuclease [Candidatus Obscuribacter sp.]|nr:HNH endonuclease [Candidatus Obscuribacter sp.]